MGGTGEVFGEIALVSLANFLSLAVKGSTMAEQESSGGRRVVTEQDIDLLRQRLNAIKHFL